jgi:hypothetical protein
MNIGAETDDPDSEDSTREGGLGASKHPSKEEE